MYTITDCHAMMGCIKQPREEKKGKGQKMSSCYSCCFQVIMKKRLTQINKGKTAEMVSIN